MGGGDCFFFYKIMLVFFNDFNKIVLFDHQQSGKGEWFGAGRSRFGGKETYFAKVAFFLQKKKKIQ